jgi:hypothetical protein
MPALELTVDSTAKQNALQAAMEAGAIIVDGGRRRPFYFDGRFLTANDLIADQNYIRARQSDLAQAIGTGVVRGLMVGLAGDFASNNPELEIQRGLGVTPAGDIVRLADTVRLRLNRVPESQIVDAQLGVKLLANAAVNNRTGLYVLALRPIEFSANPVPAYPTSLDGVRTVRDGDIIEATAITLIPYPDRAGTEDPDDKRARVAREIFYESQRPGVLQEALPLALLYISNGRLVWLDVFMVRREVGAEPTIAAGLKQRPRSLLEAWFKQHVDHVDDIDAKAMRDGFAATRYFDVLPPVGLMPAASLRFEPAPPGTAGGTLLQSFFPPLVDCEFAFVPSDEVAALVDQGLGLPPIDLSATDDDLDQLSVLIMAPVTRTRLATLKRELENLARPVRPAAPGMLAKRLPLDTLMRVSSRVLQPSATELARTQAIDAAWSGALAEAQELVQRQNRNCFWFMRRRQLPYYTEISSATLRLAGNAADIDKAIADRAAADSEVKVVDTLAERLPKLAQAETWNLLAADRLRVSPVFTKSKLFATSDVLRRSALQDLKTAVDKASSEQRHAVVLEVARRFGDEQLGRGFDAMRQAVETKVQEELQSEKFAAGLAASGVAPELDRAARTLPGDKLGAFTAAVVTAALDGKTDELRKLVANPKQA